MEEIAQCSGGRVAVWRNQRNVPSAYVAIYAYVHFPVLFYEKFHSHLGFFKIPTRISNVVYNNKPMK